jgi:hypothetical protein
VVKKNSGCHRRLLYGDRGHHAKPIAEHIPRNIFEESKRLGRDSMAAPCEAVEDIKDPNGFTRISEFDLKASSFRLPDASPNRAFETLEKLVFPTIEVNHMTMKRQRWGCVWPTGVITPAFKIPPPTAATVRDRLVIECGQVIAGSVEDSTKIGEG